MPLLVLGLASVARAAPPPPPATDTSVGAAAPDTHDRVDGAAAIEASMLERINALRAAEGAHPLERNPALDEAARVQSDDMAAQGTLAHVSARTGDPASRVRDAGVVAIRLAENIARAEDADAALRSFLASKHHRAELLDPHMTDIGMAAAAGEGGVYVTQLVARVDPSVDLPPPATAVGEPPTTGAAAPPAPGEASSGGAAAAKSSAPGRAAASPDSATVTERSASAGAPKSASGATIVASNASAPDGAEAGPPKVPTMRMPRRQRGVKGYWLFRYDRWWYFPVPRHAREGQVLYPNPKVHGAPPGYRATH